MYHIQERSFLKIILCCSLFISVKAFAEGPVGHFERVEVYDDGRYKVLEVLIRVPPINMVEFGRGYLIVILDNMLVLMGRT